MTKLSKKGIAVAVAGVAVPASFLGAAPAIAQSDDNGTLTINGGESLSGKKIEVFDFDDNLISDGQGNDSGQFELEFKKGSEGDVARVVIDDEEFEIASADCSLDGSSGSSNSSSSSSSSSTSPSSTDESSTDSSTSGSSTSSSEESPSTTSEEDGDGDGNGDGSETPTGDGSNDTEGQNLETEFRAASPAADSQSVSSPLAQADVNNASGVTENGTQISDLADGIQNGGINTVVDFLDELTNDLPSKVIGTTNDIVQLVGGYDNLKLLITMVGGPAALPITTAITIFQALGLDEISYDWSEEGNDDDNDDGSSTTDPGDNNDDDSLDVKVNGNEFTFNADTGEAVNCDIESASDNTDDSDDSRDGNTAGSDETVDGAEVNTGGSVETQVKGPSVWDRVLAVFS